MWRSLKHLRRWLTNANGYHHVSRWRVRGAIEDVYVLVANVAEYPRWWGDVFLQVVPSRSDGSTAEVQTTGLLPYRIHFCARLVDAVPLRQITIRTDGDFVGRGTWRLEEDGEHVNVSFDWQVWVRKPLIRHCSALFKPIFLANHCWAMATGQLRLQAVLRRQTESCRHHAPVLAFELV
jgi:hypothetical protein